MWGLQVPSLDAKSNCHRIRKNAGVSLSVLFWCIIFKLRSLAIIRFLPAVFVPEYEQVINIHGNDRIHRYYLVEPGDYETDDEAELLEENFGNDEEIEDGF